MRMIQCPYCAQEIDSRGFAKHELACKDEAEKQAEYEENLAKYNKKKTKTSKKCMYIITWYFVQSLSF